MRKRIIPALVVIILAALGMRFVTFADTPARIEDLTVVSASGAKHVFHVEIADTPAKDELGLMYRKSMEADHGMLFEIGAPAREVAFWMKNTYIPLDMLFIGEKGDIVHIAANAEPENLSAIPSGGPVTGVVELNGGIAQKLGIKPGDRVIHPFFH